jgi:hypothetical protein
VKNTRSFNYTNLKRQILLMIVFCVPLFTLPQVVYQDLTNSGIYDFMDKLANLKIIDLTLSSLIFQGHQNIISGEINIGF